MAWTDALSEMMTRYSGAGGGAASAPADPHQDFMTVARTAPAQVTADALAHTFRSDQTPSFPEMVSSLFQGSNADQRAGLLNQLIGSVSPAALAGIPGLSQLAGSLGRDGTVSSDLANQISVSQVQQAASHLQNGNPSIVDSISSFYAAHPNVVKALGTTAIAIAMRHIAQRA